MGFLLPNLAQQGTAAALAAVAVVAAQALLRSLVGAIIVGVGTLALLRWFGLS
jgi:branched-subunit amino acid transport protein